MELRSSAGHSGKPGNSNSLPRRLHGVNTAGTRRETRKSNSELTTPCLCRGRQLPFLLSAVVRRRLFPLFRRAQDVAVPLPCRGIKLTPAQEV
jgi:hypothetical protein